MWFMNEELFWRRLKSAIVNDLLEEFTGLNISTYHHTQTRMFYGGTARICSYICRKNHKWNLEESKFSLPNLSFRRVTWEALYPSHTKKQHLYIIWDPGESF